MYDLNDMFMYVLGVMFLIGFLLLSFCVIHDTPTKCWLSPSPFTCARVVELESK